MERTGLQKQGKETESRLYKSAVNKAMALCARREYCKSDILSKLISWGLNVKDADSAISKLVKESFVSDVRFAEAFVKDKYRQNKWGKVKIAAHLRAKKIDAEIISQALDLIEDDQYRQMIINTLYSHRKLLKSKNSYDLKAKLLRFGLSRGFESDILYDVINEE